jgi:hypothetical protein
MNLKERKMQNKMRNPLGSDQVLAYPEFTMRELVRAQELAFQLDLQAGETRVQTKGRRAVREPQEPAEKATA